MLYVVPVGITTHPQPVVVSIGQNVTLSCEATGSNPISYQWRRVNGEITSDRANGVNTSTLTISSVTEQDEDKYYCVASNGGPNGSLYSDTSDNIVLIVTWASIVSNIHNTLMYAPSSISSTSTALNTSTMIVSMTGTSNSSISSSTPSTLTALISSTLIASTTSTRTSKSSMSTSSSTHSTSTTFSTLVIADSGNNSNNNSGIIGAIGGLVSVLIVIIVIIIIVIIIIL